jgi:uncharacterized protein (TIGR02118 family)
MIKKIVLVRARPGISRTEFSRYWLEEHAALARQVPHIRRYVQNHIAFERSARSDIADIDISLDGITETWFESLEAMAEANAHPNGIINARDSAKFVGAIKAYYIDEHVIIGD